MLCSVEAGEQVVHSAHPLRWWRRLRGARDRHWLDWLADVLTVRQGSTTGAGDAFALAAKARSRKLGAAEPALGGRTWSDFVAGRLQD